MNETGRPVNLSSIVRETLVRYDFLIEPPPAAQAEAARLEQPDFNREGVHDLSDLLWSSIDNDESRDLDQIEFLKSEGNACRLYIALADVSVLVPPASALDQAAAHHTTSLYTGLRTYPLFPEKLSFDLTSLVERDKRLAVVMEMLITSDGRITESTVYRAIVKNHAQLAYPALAAWLDDAPPEDSPIGRRVTEKIQADPALQDQLRKQHALAQALRQKRTEAGALTFETVEIRPTPLADGRFELKAGMPNSATRLIEDFMIAANQASVAFLQAKQSPTLRRVVRTPKNWQRIVELAGKSGVSLPGDPDAKALEEYLARERHKDPDHFPDLSLAVIKLLGRGEYVVANPGEQALGPFALAVEGYSHSTAPNRRYPDLLTQRLLKAAISGAKPPYSSEELALLAQHCTQKEDDANKAERSIHKSLAAAALASQIGKTFEGFITGASDKGVWVRIVSPPVEGKVEGVTQGLAVGDRVVVKLISTVPWRGYIDFYVISRR